MKYIVLVGDGMADNPMEELGGKTPLEVAKIDNMNFVAQNGILGLVDTVGTKLPPASDVANLSIFGYDPDVYYTGRGPLEAENLNIELEEADVAFRCNLVTIECDKMMDYSAGHISTKEAATLIKFLDKKLGSPQIRFYPGTSYRHLVVFKTKLLNKKGLNVDPNKLIRVKCSPPHDILGQPIEANLPKGELSDILIQLMKDAAVLLQNHEINNVRLDLKENPANMIWLWGQGTKPNIPLFFDKYHIEGSVISAVDLVKGIGKLIGLKAIDVPGATGYYDTDYLAKARYAIDSLKDRDFVFVHVEAPDEAGHNGDLRAKLGAIENFDRLIVGTILKYFDKRFKNFRLLVLPDHKTPVKARTHTRGSVPFAIYGKNIEKGNSSGFNEKAASLSTLRFDKGHELMDYFIKHNIEAQEE